MLDEYDTPMQEAYVQGFWEELVAFTRSLFNATLKTNPYMARGIMTGITRVSKESIFSDLNNLKVVTTTSNEYATAFGFTEEELLKGNHLRCPIDEQMFRKIVRSWFTPAKTAYNYFVKALLLGDVKTMNVYMNKVSLQIFSYFDTGKGPLGDEPECFYHGFAFEGKKVLIGGIKPMQKKG